MNINILRKHNNIPGAKRVLFVPINTLMTDYYNAFIANGLELYSLNFEGKWNPSLYLKTYKPVMEQYFLDICKDTKPDWIFMIMEQPLISLDTFRKAKNILPNSFFTNWTGDVRATPKSGVLEVASVMDIMFIPSMGQINLFKKYGIKRVEFLQTGVNVDKFFRMSDVEREKLRKRLNHDGVFCANNSTGYPGAPLRQACATKMCKLLGNRFGLYGSGWNVPPWKPNSHGTIPYNEQNIIYNGSRVVLSINNFNDVEMYFSARQLNCMASGTLTISAYIPGLERYFENGKDLVWFKTADECGELASYYLNHQNEADEIGKAGSKKVLTYHTKKSRISEALVILGFRSVND